MKDLNSEFKAELESCGAETSYEILECLVWFVEGCGEQTEEERVELIRFVKDTIKEVVG